jgi:hypothetical protein
MREALRDSVIAPLLPIPGATGSPKKAAEFALDLFETTMRESTNDLGLRLDCAREILNRTIGKPRIADVPTTEDDGTAGGVHIFIPDNGRDQEAV